VPSVGTQLGLRCEQAGAADDQALGAEHRLGGLRLIALGVAGQRLPVGLGDLRDRGLDVGAVDGFRSTRSSARRAAAKILLFQNPEPARCFRAAG
jgi:hypothetical protein